jgi:cytochrome c biogenesis protein CcdA
MNEKIEIKNQETGMGQGHVLDLKLPIGWLLSAYGVLLTVYGLVTKKEMYVKSLGLNLNVVWGVLMLFIGAGFLLAAFLKKDKNRAASRP